MKKYWVLVGLLFVAGFLFAQNRANYDKNYYEPIKLKTFKAHPNTFVPEEVELEPDIEPAPKANTETTKPVLTKKDDKKADINKEVIVSQKEQEPKTDIKSESIADNSATSEKIAADFKSQEEKIEKEEPKNPFTFLPKGKSKAFKITPVEGVTISAEENALDKDREFSMKALSEKQIDDFGEKLNTERKETGCVISAWELHAGMADNEVLEGSFKMEFDLEKLGVLPEFYENVACYRIDDQGQWSKYDILINGSKASIESRQNSSVTLAVVDTLALSINKDGKISIRNPKNSKEDIDVLTYRPNEKWIVSNPKCSELNLRIIYDDLIEYPPEKFKNFKKIKPLGNDLLKLYYKIKNSYELKKKVEDSISRTIGTPEYTKYKNNFSQIREEYCLYELENNQECLEIANKIAKYYSDYLELKYNILKHTQKALDYYCDNNIFSNGLKNPKGTVKLKFDHTLSSSGSTGPVFDSETLNPYIRLSIAIDGSEEKYDNLTIIILHEFFHVIQRACYKNLGNDKWNEATAQFFQQEAFKWFVKEKKMTSTSFLLDEVYGDGKNYEYFAYPLDSNSGSIDGKPYSLSGQSLAKVGYTLYSFIEYAYTNKNKTDNVKNWGELLEGYYRSDEGFTSLFKYYFRNNKEEIRPLSDADMTKLYHSFALAYSDKIFNRIIANKDKLTNQKGRGLVGEMAEYYLGYADEKQHLYSDTADLLLSDGNNTKKNGQHVELINEDYTIRLRELHSYAKENYKKKDGKPKEIALQIVLDDKFKESIPDRDFITVGQEKSTKTKNGWFYHPQIPALEKNTRVLSKEDRKKFTEYKNELEKTMSSQEALDSANKKFNRIAEKYYQKNFYILEIDGGETDSNRFKVSTQQWGGAGYRVEEKEVKKSGYTIWIMYAPELGEKPFDFETVEEIVDGQKKEVEKVRLLLPKKSEADELGKCIDGYWVKIQVDEGEKIEKYFEIDKIKDQKVYFDFDELKPKDYKEGDPVTGQVCIAEYVLSNTGEKLKGPESEIVKFRLEMKNYIAFMKWWDFFGTFDVIPESTVLWKGNNIIIDIPEQILKNSNFSKNDIVIGALHCELVFNESEEGNNTDVDVFKKANFVKKPEKWVIKTSYKDEKGFLVKEDVNLYFDEKTFFWYYGNDVDKNRRYKVREFGIFFNGYKEKIVDYGRFIERRKPVPGKRLSYTTESIRTEKFDSTTYELDCNVNFSTYLTQKHIDDWKKGHK